MMNIKKVVVAGSGTMGLGIAQVCAMAGYETVLYDVKQDLLKKAENTIQKNVEKAIALGKISEEAGREGLSRLIFVTSFEDLKGDVIIEAIPEILEIKTRFFTEVSQINDDHTLLATNTSSIPVTQIAAGTPCPQRVIGLHFFNPAHLMRLVEVIKGARTDEAYVPVCMNFIQSLGKHAVLTSDAPGFIVNRVARHYYVESLKILEEGVATFQDIDTLMESAGFKMGPFRLMDLIGVDTNYAVTDSMFSLFNYENRFRPNRIQYQKVLAGLHGRKTGEGFYTY
jgi:3-hydroxybutyryl-CoA dehydrogenase